jgi:hypothetical protein
MHTIRFIRGSHLHGTHTAISPERELEKMRYTFCLFACCLFAEIIDNEQIRKEKRTESGLNYQPK